MQGHSDTYHGLYEWRDPQQLFNMVEAERFRLDVDVFLCSGDAKILREAWVAAQVGILIGVDRAKMSDIDRPDAFFELRGGRQIPVEVTELLQKGRRRGDERTAKLHHLPDEELAAAEDCNEPWLEAAITKKLNKDVKYPPGTILLVYHNTYLFVANSIPEGISKEFESAAQRKGENIIGSIILRSGKVYGDSTIRSLQA